MIQIYFLLKNFTGKGEYKDDENRNEGILDS